jgi:hypothetical protein
MPQQSGSPAVDPQGPNIADIAAQRPNSAARGYVKNLLIEDVGNPEMPSLITFPFRPSSIRIDTSVNDESMDVIGMSHQYETYVNTTNAQVSFELYLNALMMLKESGPEVETPGGQSIYQKMSDEIQLYRKFLQATLYPGVNPAGVIGAQQAPLILCLPGVLTIRCKLKQLGELISDCDVRGQIKEMRMALAFREAPMARISMEDVMTNGMFRTWGQ